MMSGVPGRRTRDYVRNGLTALHRRHRVAEYEKLSLLPLVIFGNTFHVHRPPRTRSGVSARLVPDEGDAP